MNDRKVRSSGHLEAKPGEMVEATLQVAPNREGLLRANVTSSLRTNVVRGNVIRANVVRVNVASRKCHSTT